MLPFLVFFMLKNMHAKKKYQIKFVKINGSTIGVGIGSNSK